MNIYIRKVITEMAEKTSIRFIPQLFSPLPPAPFVLFFYSALRWLSLEVTDIDVTGCVNQPHRIIGQGQLYHNLLANW